MERNAELVGYLDNIQYKGKPLSEYLDINKDGLWEGIDIEIRDGIEFKSFVKFCNIREHWLNREFYISLYPLDIKKVDNDRYKYELQTITVKNIEELGEAIIGYFTGKKKIEVSYLANIYKHKRHWEGLFFDFDGCVTTGKDFYDCVKNAKEALSMHISGMLEDGDILPTKTVDVRIDEKVREREGVKEDYIILIETELE